MSREDNNVRVVYTSSDDEKGVSMLLHEENSKPTIIQLNFEELPHESDFSD
jgi:hypothetical protein